MSTRISVVEQAPELYRAVAALDAAVKKSGIDPHLLHLIKLRASQINGCAYCVDMHVKQALADGMAAQKLHLTAVWRETSIFSPQERATLEWTECLTLIAQSGVPDSVYAAVEKVFSGPEIAQLTVAIGTINVWNRIAISSGVQPPVDA